MPKPRQPGSQVAPNLRPLHDGDRRTASKHSRVPIAQATAGKLYRVRDKDWEAVHGEGLTWDEAVKLREQVVGAKKSRTARVEDMEVAPPDWYVSSPAEEPAQVDVEPARAPGPPVRSKPYRDTTVTPPPPRNVNPPRDMTAQRGPVFVRDSAPPAGEPSPPPSPLKAATALDGDPLAPDALTDDDLPDLLGDLGGGASDADLAHALRAVKPL